MKKKYLNPDWHEPEETMDEWENKPDAPLVRTLGLWVVGIILASVVFAEVARHL